MRCNAVSIAMVMISDVLMDILLICQQDVMDMMIALTGRMRCNAVSRRTHNEALKRLLNYYFVIITFMLQSRQKPLTDQFVGQKC